jgi:integrase/recombinase XerD
VLQNATFFVAIVEPCIALQRGNQVAIITVYYRQKVAGTGWRYRPLTVGRRPEAAKNGPYFIRVRNGAGKYQWVKHDTEQAAAKAAKAAPVARQAHELGLTVDDLTNEANANRISVKTGVENYLQDRRFGRPRSIAAYENAFDQLLENLPRGVRFIDQLATSQALNSYVEFLREQDYSNKTITIRMGFVFSLLKANGVEKPSKLIKLPKVQRTRTKAYNPDELSKLFAAMTLQEYLRYLFFVRTGCREQEVQYATWKDLDLKGFRFMVSGEGKSDVGFVPKNHEERQVPLTTELGSLLADHKKHAVSDRWVFTNEDGKPEGHFLRKFKAIAKRAGLNCGQCKVAIREGRYDNRHEVEVTCETRPVCEEHYLHRLRKTAATNWLRSGFDLMKIKTWLGHKSLEVTQIYLDSEMHDPEEQMKLDRAGKF